MTFQEVLDAARHLEFREQSVLIYLLEEEMRMEIEATPLTEEQIAELDRRIAEAEAHPEALIPWEEVKAAARARYRKPQE